MSLTNRKVNKANIFKFSIRNQEVSVFAKWKKICQMQSYFSGRLVDMENSVLKSYFVSESLSNF